MVEVAKHTGGGSEASLSILTQNIYGIPLAKEVQRRTKSFVERINNDANGDYFDADFVAIQEAFTPASRKNLKKSPEHPYFSYAKKRRCLKLINGGVAALSEYPIIHQEFMSFSIGKNSDALADKGVLLTRIQHPQLGEVDFYTLHLQAAYQNADQYADVRAQQIREALDFVQKNSGPRTAILSGDFNMRESHAPYGWIQEAGFIDVMREMYPDQPLKTWRASNPFVNDSDNDERLDYIFLKPGNEWEWIREDSRGNVMTPCGAESEARDVCWGDETISDHYGIFASIKMRRRI